MDTLRTLSLVFLSFLVFAPAFAQTTFNATSGSMVIHPGDQGVPYTVAGSDFSASGNVVGPAYNPLDSPYFPGLSNSLFVTGDSASGFFDMSLTVRSVPWSYPVGTTDDGQATARFLTLDSGLTHPGIFSFPWHHHARCGSRSKLSGTLGHQSGELQLQGSHAFDSVTNVAWPRCICLPDMRENAART